MKYRPHRASLADSMADLVEIDGTRDALIELIRTELRPWPTMDHFPQTAIHVSSYGGPDARIGWDQVFIVTLDGYGVLGFTDHEPV